MKRVRIFTASPSEVEEERDVVSLVIQEMRRTVGMLRQIDLESVRWETHAWPDVGADAQDVINQQIGEYDLLIGIMWKRFGTATSCSSSGTEEEFDRAYKCFEISGRPKIMFYFRTTPFYMTKISDISQFKKVIQFKKRLEKLGVLYWEYGDSLQFERYVREHLIRQILLLTQPKEPTGHPRLFLSCVREDTAKVEQIYKSLRAAGFLPWMDVRDLLPGQNWQQEIRRQLVESSIFIVFLSENFSTKKGYMRKEISMAMNVPRGDFYLLLVRLDPIQIPSTLSRYSCVDYFLAGGEGELISRIEAISRRIT